MWTLPRTRFAHCNGSTSSDEKEIAVNIGGVRLVLRGDILSRYPDSRLAELVNCSTRSFDVISSLCDDYDLGKREFYFDRDPDSFKCIVEVYYFGEIHMKRGICPICFIKEMEFWKIDLSYLDECCKSDLTEKEEELAEIADKVKLILDDLDCDPNVSRNERWQKFLWKLMEKTRLLAPRTRNCRRVLPVYSSVICGDVSRDPTGPPGGGFRGEPRWAPDPGCHRDGVHWLVHGRVHAAPRIVPKQGALCAVLHEHDRFLGHPAVLRGAGSHVPRHGHDGTGQRAAGGAGAPYHAHCADLQAGAPFFWPADAHVRAKTELQGAGAAPHVHGSGHLRVLRASVHHGAEPPGDAVQKHPAVLLVGHHHHDHRRLWGHLPKNHPRPVQRGHQLPVRGDRHSAAHPPHHQQFRNLLQQAEGARNRRQARAGTHGAARARARGEKLLAQVWRARERLGRYLARVA